MTEPLHSVQTAQATVQTTGEATSWKPLVAFTGQGKEYFFLLLKVFLLSICTLGIYSFWGKVKRRAYLWNATHVLGTPLEYTGTGKELFLSFLIVIPILFIFFAIFYALMMIEPIMAQVVVYIFLIYAWHFASYRTIRYRLTRTRWRGIRGNLTGGANAYAIKAFGYTLATICTCFILGPWSTSKIVGMQLNNTVFGNRRTAFDGPAKDLYFAYFLVLFLSIILLAVFGYSVFSFIESMQYAPTPSDPFMAMGPLFIGYISTIIGLVLLNAVFEAAFIRWFFGHLTFGRLQMRSTLSALPLLKLRLVNLLLLTFTFGIGYAWVHMREVKIVANSIEYTGQPDLDTLLQDTMDAPKRGEGFLEAMDVDIAL